MNGAKELDPIDDNVDVRVYIGDCAYAATFFTLRNLESLFEKNSQSGACASGLYLWAADMILVRNLTESTIERTIADLISSGEFEVAFIRIA